MERPLSCVVIRDLMLETLKDNVFCEKITGGYNFSNAGGASEYDLYWIMEMKAIEKDIIDERRKVASSAWCATRMQLIEYSTTNFNREEINRIYESFYLMLNNGIIAPGMHRTSSQLPYFHITEHGNKCIAEKEILPYDFDGFLQKINSIDGLDEWVRYYLLEGLRCFNSNCNNATTIMIGLASERVVELLINEISNALVKKDYKSKATKYNKESPVSKEYLDKKMKVIRAISKKYTTLVEFIESVPEFANIFSEVIDKHARDTFVNFVRLNRNEVSHCNEVKKDSTETLMLFMSFLKYSDLITKLIMKIKMI